MAKKKGSQIQKQKVVVEKKPVAPTTKKLKLLSDSDSDDAVDLNRLRDSDSDSDAFSDSSDDGFVQPKRSILAPKKSQKKSSSKLYDDDDDDDDDSSDNDKDSDDDLQSDEDYSSDDADENAPEWLKGHKAEAPSGESEVEAEFHPLHVTLAAIKEEGPDADAVNVSDLQKLYERIQLTVAALGRFREVRHQREERKDYLDLLARDVAIYYGYSDFLTSMFMQMFSPSEMIEFLEANEAPRPVTIRVNTLRSRRRDVARSLIDRGVNLDPIKWSDVGLQVFDSSVPLGATPEYLAGQYMLQGAASFLPVVALEPQPHERVLDMCSAPGGKTTYIAAQMKNTGVLFANDVSRERIASLTANIHRLGVKNCVVTNMDGREFLGHIDRFDRILLDAPCSGLGVISRDPSVKVNRGLEDIHRMATLQQQLILTAVDLLKPGGVLVYSTCSISVDENEAVVSYALKQRKGLKVLPVDIDFGAPGLTRYRLKRFPDTMKHCRRFYPHLHNTDGFFFAKLQYNPPAEVLKAAAIQKNQSKKKDKKKDKKKKKPSASKKSDPKQSKKSVQKQDKPSANSKKRHQPPSSEDSQSSSSSASSSSASSGRFVRIRKN